HRCPHCNALLLSTESNSFCCGNGARILPALHPLPPRMRSLFDEPIRLRHVIEFCRVINNFFSFAGIGVSGGFQQFNSGGSAGPPAVAITGCTYH
ncbi:uncharacterized protein EDB91DRAFT_1024849, partial [Suillus paluster]|uniref:uncharacterized protein n=1 Tax=Suillus paluster TaxID=48578 RepID=UPI001B88294E